MATEENWASDERTQSAIRGLIRVFDVIFEENQYHCKICVSLFPITFFGGSFTIKKVIKSELASNCVNLHLGLKAEKRTHSAVLGRSFLHFALEL